MEKLLLVIPAAPLTAAPQRGDYYGDDPRVIGSRLTITRRLTAG
jgi:hypothetical protein